jgi:hypothetical protein
MQVLGSALRLVSPQLRVGLPRRIAPSCLPLCLADGLAMIATGKAKP